MPGDFYIRSALANAERRRKAHPSDPDAQQEVDRLRAEYRASALEDHIRRIVDAAPPLTRGQRERLAVLLNPERCA